jgi:hypothetical protein
LLAKAEESLIISIEIFNRPWNMGRIESFLILFDHSFELLLKAAIIHKGGNISKKGRNETIGFDQCVRSAIGYKIIDEEQALVIQTINGFRDAAQHYILDISEQHLYLQSQAGFTLYCNVLQNIFNKDIGKELPKRVLPLSTTPPLEIELLFENEIKEIRKLLMPNKRRKAEAINKLRSLAIFESTLNGNNLQPSDQKLIEITEKVKDDEPWETIFPNVASVKFASGETEHNVSLKLTKKDGLPIHLVPEGTPDATAIATRRVNELDYYNLGHKKLAEKVGLTSPKLTALVKCLGLKEDPTYFKEIKIGKSKFGRYSQNAIHFINDRLKEIDLDQVWAKYRPRRR